MINADLVNPRSLSETVRNDVAVELWMRYACLSPRIRRPLSEASAAAAGLYRRHDFSSRLSFLALTAVLANVAPALLSGSLIPLITGALAFGLFLRYELIKKDQLIELSRILITVFYTETPPRGTFFQFGEDLARRFTVTSFVDFNGSLDRFLKRFFITLFPLAILVYINISLLTILVIFTLTFAWPFFIRPVSILRVLLCLR